MKLITFVHRLFYARRVPERSHDGRHAATMVTLALIAAIFPGKPALADKRVALIIGNSAYEHVAALPNPVNDAKAVEFDVKNRRL